GDAQVNTVSGTSVHWGRFSFIRTTPSNTNPGNTRKKSCLSRLTSMATLLRRSPCDHPLLRSALDGTRATYRLIEAYRWTPPVGVPTLPPVLSIKSAALIPPTA